MNVIVNVLPLGIQIRNIYIFKNQTLSGKGNLKWRIFTLKTWKIHILFAKWFGNNSWLLICLKDPSQPTPSGKKRKCQGKPMCRKNQVFPVLFPIVNNSCWGFIEELLLFFFRLENPGNKSFLLCLHSTKIPTQLHSKRLWWPQWMALCSAL